MRVLKYPSNEIIFSILVNRNSEIKQIIITWVGAFIWDEEWKILELLKIVGLNKSVNPENYSVI